MYISNDLGIAAEHASQKKLFCGDFKYCSSRTGDGFKLIAEVMHRSNGIYSVLSYTHTHAQLVTLS